MEMTPQEYQKYVQSMAKKSPIVKDVLLAFVIGGAICCAGQLTKRLGRCLGLSKQASRHRHLLYAGVPLRPFDGTEPLQQDRPLRRRGHAGAHHRLRNAVAAPAIEFKTEGLVLGLAAKMFTIAGRCWCTASPRPSRMG